MKVFFRILHILQIQLQKNLHKNFVFWIASYHSLLFNELRTTVSQQNSRLLQIRIGVVKSYCKRMQRPAPQNFW